MNLWLYIMAEINSERVDVRYSMSIHDRSWLYHTYSGV